MTDDALLDVIRKIPQQTQRQYGTDEQLRYAMAAANKLGLYDAADAIRRMASQHELANATERRAVAAHVERSGEDWRDVRAARDFERD